jgi:hypothetical protein
MQNYHVDNPTAMSEGRHMINLTKENHMTVFQVALDIDGSYGRTIDATCAEFAAEEWAERYCAEQTEYGELECVVWLGDSEPFRVQIDIESTPVFNATIIIK